MASILGVFGYGGLAREAMHLIKCQARLHSRFDDIRFVVKRFDNESQSEFIFSEQKFFSYGCDRFFTIPIADVKLRKKLFVDCSEKFAKPFNVAAASAEIYENAQIAEGSILCSHSTVSCDTKIGRGFILNVASYIAHDCKIGDFVTIGPHVLCSGNVIIEDEVYVGGGAKIIQGTSDNPIFIGKGAVIGMGSVVINSVRAGQTVVGNPARVIKH